MEILAGATLLLIGIIMAAIHMHHLRELGKIEDMAIAAHKRRKKKKKR